MRRRFPPPASALVAALVCAAGVLPPAAAGSGVLHDNGPFATHHGTGVGGADESWVQFSIGLTAYGFVHDAGTIDEIADDFTVPERAVWSVDAITFFAYELNAPPQTTTFTTLCFMVLDGPPDTPGTHIIYGDFYTNRLTSSVWTGCFRVGEGSSGTDDNRPVMANTCVIEPPLALGPGGTYWIIWQAWGTQVSRAYAPPVTILGQADTGNGLVTEDGGYSYIPATDNHHQQGFPFVIEGMSTGSPVERASWGAVKALYRWSEFPFAIRRPHSVE
jgi:hypothetical protein